ncbi:MAG: hypothetical protein IPN62_11720 [Flavobacteriales bacterium]|nr:hypothetical protein [Flavobacteriales bacterium]
MTKAESGDGDAVDVFVLCSIAQWHRRGGGGDRHHRTAGCRRA